MNNILWAKHYDPLLDPVPEGKIIEYILDGGREGGKTQHISAAAIDMVRDPNGGSFIAARANAVDLAGSVRESIVKKIREGGLTHEFRIPDSKLTITHIPTGHKIYFRAYEKSITRTKGDEPSASVVGVWIEEANEGRNPLMLDAMLTTYYRHMKHGGKIFFSYNPMPQPIHWSHEYFAKKKLGRDTVYLWCNWTHIARFLPKPALRKIIEAKRTNEKYYRFWYQGELVSFDGLIFPQWDRKYYVTKEYVKQAMRTQNAPRFLLVGVDGGTKRDQTAAAPCLFMRNHQLVLLGKYYHNPIKTMPLAPSRQAQYIHQFLEDIYRDFPEVSTVPVAFVFDSDSGSQEIMLQLRSMYGYMCQAVRAKKVWSDVHRFQDLLDEGLFYCVEGGYKDYYTGERMGNDPFIDEIENYVYDPVTNDIKADQVDHILKAVVYTVKSLYIEPRMRTLNTEFLSSLNFINYNYKY